MPSFLSFNGSLLETIVVLQIIVIALLLVAPTVEQQNKQMKADEQERLSRVAASLERQRLEQAEADEWDRIRDVANREMDRLASPRRAAERRV
ncbi:MAG: type II secretion system GspH family protein [Zoogloea sp.]|nr:type II secretion system GspH family protein [Zoogloea sp.]